MAVVGSNGQLGTDLIRVLPQEIAAQVVPLSRSEVDVTSPVSVRTALKEARPEVVINCAAFVRVDDCEGDPETAFRVNALGSRYVAESCAALNAECVYISTDYVFNGDKTTPYQEGDPADPISAYGVSKAAGEQLVRSTLERHYIVRSSGLFGVAGASGKGGNFITAIQRLARNGEEVKVVDDQRFSPTYTDALARKIAWLVGTGRYGTWHITCRGDCTWYELATAVFHLLDQRPKLRPITSEQYAARAKRPSYSVLGHGRLQELDADDLPHWRDALEQYLRAKAEI